MKVNAVVNKEADDELEEETVDWFLDMLHL
jgi:hypothetical protein